MYYSFRGMILHKDFHSVALECGGVGYHLSVSHNTAVELPAVGEQVFLYAHLTVREGSMELCGFIKENELAAFKLLTAVSGVGVRAALSILSEMTFESVATAISVGDFKAFTKASGVGPKLAQRIVLELKDKFKGINIDNVDFVVGTAPVANGSMSEAIEALCALGFAKSAVAAALSGLTGLETDELIKRGLAALSGRK